MQAYLIVGNILSLLASLCTAISVFKRSKTDFMYWQIGNTVFAILTNFVLLSYSGVTTNFVSLIRNIYGYKNKLTAKITAALVVCSISLGMIYNNIGFIGLCPVFVSASYTICIYWMKKTQHLRYASIVDLSVWAWYYWYIQAYPSVITYVVLNIWTAIQIARHEKKSTYMLLRELETGEFDNDKSDK